MAWQPRPGYRAGADAVLLAAAVPVRTGEAVLELGCGVGVAALCLCARVAGVAAEGVEIQPAYAALARRNAAGNGLDLTVHEADIAALPAELRARSFAQVMMNPPYFDRTRGHAARDAGREAALGGGAVLHDWISAGVRRLLPGGRLTLIHRAARLGEILAALDSRMGGVVIRPVAPRAGREALHVIVQARKGGRAPLRLLAPLVLHAGDSHPGDIDHFTPEAAAILRDGAALNMG
ncbi:MAG: methyltransferase [Rubellimicrobium sp.]|nr:methyltransferase [Rubellimicrobium sp.]